MFDGLSFEDYSFTHSVEWNDKHWSIVFSVSDELWGHIAEMMEIIRGNHPKNAMHCRNATWTHPPRVVKDGKPISFGYRDMLRVVRDVQHPNRLNVIFLYKTWNFNMIMHGDSPDAIILACTSLAFLVEAIFSFSGTDSKDPRHNKLQLIALSMYICYTEGLNGWCMVCHVSPHAQNLIAKLQKDEQETLEREICTSMENAWMRLHGKTEDMKEPIPAKKNRCRCRVKRKGEVSLRFLKSYRYAPYPNERGSGYTISGANMDNPIPLLVCLAGIATLGAHLHKLDADQPRTTNIP